MNFDNTQSRIEAAEKFFNLLYGNVTERKFGYLWTKKGDERKTYPFTVSNADERKAMAAKAIELNDDGFDVYYGVNLLDNAPARNARAKHEIVTVQTASIADLDIEGGMHISDDKKKYPPTFDVAKSFLPFPVSILVNSGYGAHGLCLYSTPLEITDANRAQAKQRNQKFISAIRDRAGIYSKSVDGIGDLARVLRVPGTRNYKLGISEDAPICHVVEDTGLRFTPTDLDERLNALTPAKAKSKQERTPKKIKAANFDSADKPTEQERAIAMLEKIPCAEQTYGDWIAAGMILKNNGNTCSDWEEWSRADERFKDGECESKWQGFDEHGGLTIATLHDFARKLYDYSEKEFQREWYQLHPEKSKRRNRNEPAQVTNSNDIYAQIRRQCKWSHDKNGNPTKIKPDVFNYEIVFEQDPNLHGLFGRDNFRQETVFLKRAPWHEKYLQLKDSWDDTDDAELRLYLAKHYAEMGTQQRTLDFVIRVARENSFHAIRNFFESLPKWDGVERADNIFIKFLGAEDSRYTREITRHFLFGAIARALYPGCDFQSVVVIQGAQGIGKSRLLRMLGGKHGVNPKGDSWHIALRDQLDDSHAVDAMRKGWIVEIEEFAAASRADVNSMKGVLSADDVTRRFAYDRHAKTIKAHWIFAATCNDDAPLRDQTGNRRFLPIKCHNKESTIVEGMNAEYIRQVWSEAYHKFKEMFPTAEDFDADKLRLTPDFQSQAAKYAEGITQDDGLTTEIKGFLDKKIPPKVIWYLLSKEERRKFHVDGGKITIEKADLQARFKNTAGNRYDELKPVFEAACTVKDGYVREFTDKNDRWWYAFYGTAERQHICAAEIFNECFGQDNRKRMPRINEKLATLDGWHSGDRLQKVDPAYPDQKKPYYRDKKDTV